MIPSPGSHAGDSDAALFGSGEASNICAMKGRIISLRRIALTMTVMSLSACVSTDGISTNADVSPSNIPVVGQALHGANVAQTQIPQIPGQILNSIVTQPTSGVVIARDNRELPEDRRILRRMNQGLPPAAEDRIRDRMEDRRDPRSGQAHGPAITPQGPVIQIR